MPIQPIGTIATPAVSALSSTSSGASAPAAGSGAAFTASLGKLLDATNVSDQAANTAVGQMIDGTGDVHEAMIALQQADMMLQLTVQVRNKLVQAYQDIMRMPV
jgi:flagellar hook-basal body complex protein FliE